MDGPMASGDSSNVPPELCLATGRAGEAALAVSEVGGATVPISAKRRLGTRSVIAKIVAARPTAKAKPPRMKRMVSLTAPSMPTGGPIVRDQDAR
jgi:hypothetical protein